MVFKYLPENLIVVSITPTISALIFIASADDVVVEDDDDDDDDDDDEEDLGTETRRRRLEVGCLSPKRG